MYQRLSKEEVNLAIAVISISHNQAMNNNFLLENINLRKYERYEKVIKIIDRVLGHMLSTRINQPKNILLSNHFNDFDYDTMTPITLKELRNIMQEFFHNDYSVELWADMISNRILYLNKVAVFDFKHGNKFTFPQIKYLLTKNIFHELKMLYIDNPGKPIQEILKLLESNNDHKNIRPSQDYISDILRMPKIIHKIPDVVIKQNQSPIVMINEQIKPKTESIKITANISNDEETKMDKSRFTCMGLELPYSKELLEHIPCTVKKSVCDYVGFHNYRGLKQLNALGFDKRKSEFKALYQLLMRARFVDVFLSGKFIETTDLAFQMHLWDKDNIDGQKEFLSVCNRKFIIKDEMNIDMKMDDIANAINYNYFNKTSVIQEPKKSIIPEPKKELPDSVINIEIEQTWPKESKEFDINKFKLDVICDMTTRNFWNTSNYIIHGISFIYKIPENGFARNHVQLSNIIHCGFNQINPVINTLLQNGYIIQEDNILKLNRQFFDEFGGTEI